MISHSCRTKVIQVYLATASRDDIVFAAVALKCCWPPCKPPATKQHPSTFKLLARKLTPSMIYLQGGYLRGSSLAFQPGQSESVH
jgi:hypothetical protein